MRLTHLKLAGFKSFVDPTTLHLHGQRVGIVGPNGCGKSNVMEAIRWVLGESSAKELRGDSLQDVIFNGSLNRKPVSRASVELHFDNSFGGAPGQWSQYAEISVKRVLERDGNSSYIINNTQVRRRDVTDLFLGTGVGSRAYAIIGQNTISRIVEAKPEELRVFLEEAAGVSKYKERRRETELRLRDTRENLLRVDDIRRELANQIVALESQAEVATRYHALKLELETTQQLHWLLKKRQAAIEWEKTRKKVESLVNELEAEMAALRKSESDLEQARLQHAEASSHLQQKQAAFYESNAALSNLEQQIRHAQETLDRAAVRESEMRSQLGRLEAQVKEHQADLTAQKQSQAHAEAHRTEAQNALQTSRAAIPELEMRQRSAQHILNASHAEVTKVEQAVQLELSSLQHQRRGIEQLKQRVARLEAEKQEIVCPDPVLLSENAQLLQHLQKQLAALEADVITLQELEASQQSQLVQAQQLMHEGSRNIARHETQLTTLRKIQDAVGSDAKLSEWLVKNDLSGKPRFWQKLEVDTGWETALESSLGNHLNALVIDSLGQLKHIPSSPVSVSFCAPTAPEPSALETQLPALLEKVRAHDPALQSVLEDCLAGIFVAESLEHALSFRDRLHFGERLVCPDGHLLSPTSISLYAPNSALHGVLERQRELESLEKRLPELASSQAGHESLFQTSQQSLAETRRRLHEVRHDAKQISTQQHAVEIEMQKLHQQQLRADEQLSRISREFDVTAQQIAIAEQQIISSETGCKDKDAQLVLLRQKRDENRTAQAAAESALANARDVLRQQERAAQEREFSLKEVLNKIMQIESIVNVLDEQISAVKKQCDELVAQRSTHDMSALRATLEQAVETHRQREEATAEARNTLAGIESLITEIERKRMLSEHQLHPLRDRLEQGRLSEQEARLNFELCARELADKNEDALAAMLEKGARPSDLAEKAGRLQLDIDALGAVNLAAIDQLQTERERANYLDAQAQDLGSAIETLEEAIRRIDKETRSRLQHTFDEVNRNFAELYSTLFNGGQARLELLGDEILDTGVQVFAQPPGKKNSTIHLLSGGEKALTALALVFALFRLNPAPFCLMDEVDAPLDDSNTERFCSMVRKMSEHTQFVFISHNKIAMEMAQQLIGVTMQESGVSRVVEVDVEEAMRMAEMV